MPLIPEIDLSEVCVFLNKEDRSGNHDAMIYMNNNRYRLGCAKCGVKSLVEVERRFSATNHMDVLVAFRDAWTAHVSPAPAALLIALEAASGGQESYAPMPKPKPKRPKPKPGASGERKFDFSL